MNNTLKTTLIAIAIPTAYAIMLRLLFGIDSWNDLFSVMSISFLFCLPAVIGALTVYFSDKEKAKSVTYQICTPWITVFLFLVITLALSIEGWACWLMILPIFLLAASIGGLVAGYLKRRHTNNKLKISLLALLPFFMGPVESLVDAIPATYKAYTYIDIHAPAEKIWDNVTRVAEIPAHEDKGYLNRLLGFPRPVKAALNFEGVGAFRKAVFTKGLVFHETVTEYRDNERMVFNIEAYPHQIPSTTLDKHVTIGGTYFDVLKGTYKLEKLATGQYRLHLSSQFTMNTTFNFYAGWWAKWIMKDIQNNILRIQKKRAENNETL